MAPVRLLLCLGLCLFTVSGLPLYGPINRYNSEFQICEEGQRMGGYKLFTRETKEDGDCILPNSDSIGDSAFNSEKRIVIFAHGYLGAGWNWYMHEMKDAVLTKEDVNFIIVDWSKGSVDWLPDAYDAAKVVADELAVFLRLFRDMYKVPQGAVHLIGHSMGGRVMGLTGEKMNPMVGRITGLDPVPGRYKGLANFTDVIHTTFLADEAIADANFWPNNLDIGGDIPWVSPHMYAVYMYTESVNRCQFTAHQCGSWEDHQAGRCQKNTASRMGHYASQYPGRGKMYLTIKKEPPFC